MERWQPTRHPYLAAVNVMDLLLQCKYCMVCDSTSWLLMAFWVECNKLAYLLNCLFALFENEWSSEDSLFLKWMVMTVQTACVAKVYTNKVPHDSQHSYGEMSNKQNMVGQLFSHDLHATIQVHVSVCMARRVVTHTYEQTHNVKTITPVADMGCKYGDPICLACHNRSSLVLSYQGCDCAANWLILANMIQILSSLRSV